MRIESDPAIGVGGGRNVQRRPGFSIGCLSLLVIGFLLLGLVGPYTDYLWYAHDARHPEVFSVAYSTKGLLFALAFVLAVTVFALNLTRALGVAMVYVRVPESFGEAVVANVLSWMQRNASGAVKIAALVLGFFFAIGFSAETNTYLLWRNGGDFGVKDPLFGKDLGFFVFQLPWMLAVLNFLCGLMLLASLSSLAIYVGMQSMARLAKIELSRPAIRNHLCLLFGTTILLYAVQVWLRVYEYGLVDGSQFTGAGFADIQKLGAQRFLAIGLALVGIGTYLDVRSKKPYSVPIGGGLIIATWWLLAMVAYPGIIQRFRVEPDKLTVEGPYASRAIKMTRWAYNLDTISVRNTEVSEKVSASEVKGYEPTLQGMRLWDPEILRRTIEVQQGLRTYYAFHDVDVDRYVINGKPTPVMLSPRDVRIAGLSPNARAWINERLQYTHGFGIVMVAVNGADENGRPFFLIKDFPPKTPPDLPLTQPRLYFSDFRDDQRKIDDPYALVKTGVKEIDYPLGDTEKTYLWTGERGVPISGFLSKLAFSMALADGNLLVSQNITDQTRVLMHRNVLERARRVYPFLKFDLDPYIVVHEGRLVWMLDGYSTTNSIPYSDKTEASSGAILNYIRNSVKITIDADSGDMNAYAILPDEPILKAFRRIYPKLVKDVGEMPPGLVAHWRYPEDLFRVQAHQLCQYHVTASTIFLNNSDAWEIPIEQGPYEYPKQLDPYYVQIQLSGSPKPRFMLILPFTPRAKPNMSGWLAAHCDPDEFGKQILFKFPTVSSLPGPGQMEAKISQDPEIANINKLWNTEYSRLISGNLLVVPMGESVLYVKPLFLESRQNAIPELKRVVLAIGNGQPVVAESYGEALKKLFGEGQELPPAVAAPAGAQPPGQAPPSRNLKADLREALKLLDEADAALRSGDFAKYGQLQKQAREKLKALSK